MILYLTSSSKVNLLDFIEIELEMPIKKLIGSFSLNSFVVKDMRFYNHVRYVAIERGAIKETDKEMVQALLSFQMMYKMRIIVISEGLLESSPILQELIQADIQNVVIAEKIDKIQDELRECFSDVGMLRRKAEREFISLEAMLQLAPVEEVTQFRFNCTNVIIAIAGCDRRVGVTTTAFNLVCWINAHGGTACYVEANSNNHLAHIIQLFKPKQSGSAFIMEDSDFYFNKELNQDYNFIIFDIGVLKERNLQEAFLNADIRILCGSAMPYELVGFYRALERCQNFSVHALGLFVPDNIKPYLSQSISKNIVYCNSSHDLFDSKSNSGIFEMFLKEHFI
ncbi:hypothetical protein [Paenibacillus donghaensis]|uniref:Uncharacterized protein n=1 Tax=Paenibacillus donghaensis TaxID=414771 RepID=A0A2Z2KJF7_9BACL|nr:hypothetical protein [Paenibacillus donghaensis]ASA23420.1 hypothetical protein B9T62_23005 [Paenibacillus donghaensis]